MLSITLEPQETVGISHSPKYYLAASPVVGAATTVESTAVVSATGAATAVLSAVEASSVFAEPQAVNANTATARMNLYIGTLHNGLKFNITKLPPVDSNHDNQIQSLMSCH